MSGFVVVLINLDNQQAQLVWGPFESQDTAREWLSRRRLFPFAAPVEGEQDVWELPSVKGKPLGSRIFILPIMPPAGEDVGASQKEQPNS